MFDYLGVLVLAVVAALPILLARRVWRSSRTWLRWTAVPLCGLLSLVAIAALVTGLRGFFLLNQKHDNPVPQVEIVSSPEAIARGEKYAMLCAGCHSPDESLPMAGHDFLEDAPPVGRLYAPNLTPTHLAGWTDGEIIRAIREGVHKDGRALIIMPSRFFKNLSDEHVASIVAYLRSQPPVEPDTPPAAMNVLGAILVQLFDVLEAQEPITEPVHDPPPGATVEYGKYLASTTCTFCHGADLKGDKEMGGTDITLLMGGWSEEHLITMMRTGVRPGGAALDPEKMPWELLSRVLDDDDVRAIYIYLRELSVASRSG